MTPVLRHGLHAICLLLGLLALLGLGMPRAADGEWSGKARVAWMVAEDRGADPAVLPDDADPPDLAILRTVPPATLRAAVPATADGTLAPRPAAFHWPESRAPPRFS